MKTLRWVPVLRLVALIAFVSIAWCVMLNRLSLSAWQTPLSYFGDSLVILGRIKVAAEGHYWPLASKNVPSLGAPFIANWDSFPNTEDVLYLILGLLSRVVGLIPAANAGVLLAHVLSAVSFYAACRMMRCRWEWSFIGALAYALSPYLFFRSLPHLSLTYAWHVPLLLCVAWWLSTRYGLRLGSRRSWLAFGIALITGLQNPYYTFLLVQLTGLAFVIHVVRRSGRRQLIAPVLCAGVVMAGWVFGNFDSLRFQAASPLHRLTASRPYADLETYALKPVALLTPLPNHRWELWNQLGERYRRGTSPFNEAHFAYIGLLAIGSVALLAGVSFARLARTPRKRLPFQAWQMLWIVLSSVPGGLGGILGLLGLTIFRGSNRYSVAVMALALLFVAQWLTGVMRQRPAWLRLSLAAVLGVLVAWDQLPRLVMPDDIARIARIVESDRDFAQRLEHRLPSGAMIFQLPMAGFPEWPTIHRMSDYQHLRPFLFSNNLRFSYGNQTNNPVSHWQEELEGMTPLELAQSLERYGFAAIQIHRAGFPDRGASLIESLRESGRSETIESTRGDLVAIVLHPREQPERPVVWVTFSDGWHSLEIDMLGSKQRWSSGNARVIVHNDSAQPVTRYVSFQVSTIITRQIRLDLGNQALLDVTLAENEGRDISAISLTLQPGDNVLQFTTDRPARQASSNDMRQVAFLIRDFRLRP
ncbi:MAG: hypothetical protein RMN25_05700 [Anaerolineae bacterium]|nr:hypothetical protein [Thermoflexales bacterium]MDW8407259.1 hypothetical protein [Anaerolineae bacterium]